MKISKVLISVLLSILLFTSSMSWSAFAADETTISEQDAGNNLETIESDSDNSVSSADSPLLIEIPYDINTGEFLYDDPSRIQLKVKGNNFSFSEGSSVIAEEIKDELTREEAIRLITPSFEEYLQNSGILPESIHAEYTGYRFTFLAPDRNYYAFTEDSLIDFSFSFKKNDAESQEKYLAARLNEEGTAFIIDPELVEEISEEGLNQYEGMDSPVENTSPEEQDLSQYEEESFIRMRISLNPISNPADLFIINYSDVSMRDSQGSEIQGSEMFVPEEEAGHSEYTDSEQLNPDQNDNFNPVDEYLPETDYSDDEPGVDEYSDYDFNEDISNPENNIDDTGYDDNNDLYQGDDWYSTVEEDAGEDKDFENDSYEEIPEGISSVNENTDPDSFSDEEVYYVDPDESNDSSQIPEEIDNAVGNADELPSEISSSAETVEAASDSTEAAASESTNIIPVPDDSDSSYLLQDNAAKSNTSAAETSSTTEKANEAATVAVENSGMEMTSSEAAAASFIPLTGTCGDNLTWSIDENGTLIVSGAGEMKDFEASGSAPWNDYYSTIKKVIISDGITQIGNFAFCDYLNIEEVSLPDGLLRIGTDVFQGCGKLTKINLPDSVEVIDGGTFTRCTSLENIVLPEKIKTIEWSAFKECTSLKKIDIPEGVTSIGGFSFYGCSSLTDVIIPESVTKFEQNAFAGTPWLESLGDFAIVNRVLLVYQGKESNIVIPQDVLKIAAAAFEHQSDIESVLIQDGVEEIANSSFSGCTDLKTVEIPDTVALIGSAAFSYCESLKDVTLPKALTLLDDYTFSSCIELASVTIPPSVENIMSSAFNGCSALKIIYGEKGSYAETFANENGYEFREILLTINTSGIYDLTISEQIENVTVKVKDSSKNEIDPVECILEDSESSKIRTENFYKDGACLNLACESAVENESYFTAIVKDGEWTSDHIYYLDQKTANGGEISFDLYPRDMVSGNYSVFLICGEQGEENPQSVKDPTAAFSYYRFVSGGEDAYEIKYELDGGTNHSENPKSYKNGDQIILKDPVKEGFIFSGWYLDEEFSSIITEITGESSGDIILYAKWKKEEITEKNIADAVITLEEQTVTYDGSEKEPAVKVSFNGDVLVKGTDYTVAYSDNINAGTDTAKVTVSGTGSYTGTIEKTFSIARAALVSKDITISADDLIYNGKAHKPAVIVKHGGKKLVSGTDYSVVYSNNIHAGTASVKVTGKGNYSGTVKKSFTIAKKNQSIKVTAAATRIAAGKTTIITVTGAKGTVTFKSTSASLATAKKKDSKTCTVKAVKPGKVKITVTAAKTTDFNAISKAINISIVPAATSKLTATNQATGIKLTWQKVAGANAYHIYRGGTKITTVKNGSTITYTDKKANTNGTKYVYKIVASASSTGSSMLSKSVTIYRVERPAVKSLANSGSRKMTVKWGKNAKATGYQIQYCTDKTFKSGNKSLTVSNASTVTRVITGLTKGKIYYVRIRTFKTVGSTKYISEWSAVKSVKITK